MQAPAWRRKGIGRLLMEECLQCVQRSRGREIYLHVDPERQAAVALYHSFGFEVLVILIHNPYVARSD